MNARTTDLAFQLADDTARSDIETLCKPVGGEPQTIEAMQTCYYDTTALYDLEMSERVKIALEYLDGRGMLKRHPSNANWLRVIDAPAIARAA